MAKSREHLTEKQIARKKKIAAVVDKITTGIFIALMASPIAILVYIFTWFASNMGYTI